MTNESPIILLVTDDDHVFKALADPTRRFLLDLLFQRDGQALQELESGLAMTRFGVMKHLKVLEGAGLVTRSREAQWRPCRIDAIALKEVDDWLEKYRRFWEVRLDRLEEYLDRIQSKDKPKTANRKKPKKRPPAKK